MDGYIFDHVLVFLICLVTVHIVVFQQLYESMSEMEMHSRVSFPIYSSPQKSGI